ncbi:MAG: DUF3179 domain-containing protein, partial [Acidobacteriota bacterium]
VHALMPQTTRRVPVALACALMALLAGPACAQVANGFDLSGALIPVGQIHGGGPPRDGIPALTDPPRVSAGDADTWMDDKDRVIGVVAGGEAVAYPIRILNWHEIVNDIVGDHPIAVSYCPLCGTGVVFDARLQGRRAVFGVSGLLYNSDVLMYDKRSMSLISQMMFQAVTGPLRGTRLATLPASTTTWETWKARHPATLVLSQNQPYGRDYSTDPYHWYRTSGNTMFPVRGDDTSRSSKSWAWLVVTPGEELVVAEAVLDKVAGDLPARFHVGEGVTLRFDPAARELSGTDEAAGALLVVPGYWFALTAFHPDARDLAPDDLIPVQDEAAPGAGETPARP